MRQLVTLFYFVGLMLFLGAAAQAQDAGRNVSPDKTEAPYIQHKFFDAINTPAIGFSAFPIIGDSLSTQSFLATGVIVEGNPIARPFVNSSGGQAFISAAGFGSMVGGMYLLHRLEGHEGNRHKVARHIFTWLERATPLVVSGVEFNRWHHNNVLIQETR